MRTPRRRRKPDQRVSNERPTKPGRAQQLKLLLEKIEQERANLSRAESLLECLRIAMEYESQTATGPYYPDVAQIAHELVHKSVNALDPIHMPRLERDKVREEFRPAQFTQLCMQFERASGMRVAGRASTGPCALASLLSPPVPEGFARRLGMRLHRRNYSRESVASSGGTFTVQR